MDDDRALVSHPIIAGCIPWNCIKTCACLDADFIPSLGEGSQIVEYVGCQLRKTSRDCRE